MTHNDFKNQEDTLREDTSAEMNDSGIYNNVTLYKISFSFTF